MAFLLVLAVTGIGVMSPAAAKVPPADSTVLAAEALTANAPLALQFVPNVGQWSSEFLYLTRAVDLDALFMRNHVELRLRDTQTPATLGLRPLGADNPIMQPGLPRVTVLNDFRGQQPEQWRSGISTYESLSYVELYPEVDWVFRTENQQLVYDFVLKPGADPKDIRVAVEGAEQLTIEPDGSMIVTLPDGRTFSQQPPVIYQERDGQREFVAGRFRLLAAAVSMGLPDRAGPAYGFEIDDYDASRPLVIDPTLGFMSFVGGGRDESVSVMKVTEAGEVIVAGTTGSTDFAGGAGGLGRDDGYIFKLDNSGSALVFVTLFGGSANDAINDIAVDTNGTTATNDDLYYIAGSTSSEDLPLVNPLFGVLTGRSDAFVTKLDANGALSNFSTYYGGNGTTSAQAIDLDLDKNIYIAGTTAAADLVVRDAIQPRYAGSDDGFIVRFSKNGYSLDYATYFGGSGNDSIDHLTVSGTGDLFIAGSTSSPGTNRDEEPDFPVKNALQPTLAGRQDSFLARIARGGSELVFNTYIGGSAEDVLTDFAIDSDGHYLLAGYTSSEDWPTVNALIADYPPGSDEMGTLAKVDRSGRFVHFSTYIGAAGSDRVMALGPGYKEGGGDVVYIAGMTDSNAFPVHNPFQNFHSGEGDGFLMQLDSSGQIILSSTYFGGGETDEIVEVEYHAPTDVVFFVGLTSEERNTSLFPVGGVASIAPHAGGIDNFVARLDNITRGVSLPALLLDSQLNPIHPEAASVSAPEITFAVQLEDRAPSERGVIAFATKIFYDPEVLEYSGVRWGSGTVLDGLTPGVEKTVTGGDGELELWVLQGSTPGRLDTNLLDSIIAHLDFNLVNVGDPTDSPPLPSAQVLVRLQSLSSATIEDNLDAVIYGSSGSRFIERRCNSLIGDCDCSGRVQLFEIHTAVEHFLAGDATKAPICLKPDYETFGSAVISSVIDHYLNSDLEPGAGLLNGPMARGLLSQSENRELGVTSANVDRLDFSEPEIGSGYATIDLVLRSSVEPSLLSADIHYDPDQITAPEVTAGPMSVNAGKKAEFNIVEPGWLRVLVYGINRTTIPDGVVATIGFSWSSDKRSDEMDLYMDAAAAIPADGGVSLATNAITNGQLGCSNEAMLRVTEAYIGYYNRCPDLPGMNYWCMRLDSQGRGHDLSEIIAAFGTSQEYTDRFSALADHVLINNLYQNMFGRDAELAGLNFYVDLLVRHESTWLLDQGTSRGATEYALSRIALDILNGATGPDFDMLESKVSHCGR